MAAFDPLLPFARGANVTDGVFGMQSVLSFFEALLFFAVALVCIAVGAAAIRDITRGSAQSLSRMSTRVYYRSENPSAFWITVATGLFWGLLGIFLLVVGLSGFMRIW